MNNNIAKTKKQPYKKGQVHYQKPQKQHENTTIIGFILITGNEEGTQRYIDEKYR